jgi:hypothetical protein
MRAPEIVQAKLETELGGNGSEPVCDISRLRSLANENGSPWVGEQGNIRASAGSLTSDRSTAAPSGTLANLTVVTVVKYIVTVHLAAHASTKFFETLSGHRKLPGEFFFSANVIGKGFQLENSFSAVLIGPRVAVRNADAHRTRRCTAPAARTWRHCHGPEKFPAWGSRHFSSPH